MSSGAAKQGEEQWAMVSQDGTLIRFDNQTCRRLASEFDHDAPLDQNKAIARLCVAIIERAAMEVDHILRAGGGTQGDSIRAMTLTTPNVEHNRRPQGVRSNDGLGFGAHQKGNEMTNEKRYWNALRTIASMPISEQDNMISANMRHVAREALAGEETTVRYGCHCDLEPGANPDGCVLDYDRPEDCIHAPALVQAGKGREACHEWRPVAFERPNV